MWVTYSNIVENIKEETWNKYQILLKYPAKIKCSEATLIAEFRNLWPVCNRLWPRSMMIQKQQIWWWQWIFWITIWPTIQICWHCCKFCLRWHQRPLEKSYSQLEKLCYKDRNWLKSENMESLYILSTLKEPVKIHLKGACSFLEKK